MGDRERARGGGRHDVVQASPLDRQRCGPTDDAVVDDRVQLLRLLLDLRPAEVTAEQARRHGDGDEILRAFIDGAGVEDRLVEPLEDRCFVAMVGFWPDRPGEAPQHELVDLAERLSDRLETRVRVDLGKTKGKITVEFASMEDLQRIIQVMDPRNRDDRPI